ncbi:HlyU family transcriptional regulator [Oceaniglobus ichthyenteri]|uniref:HlyU family transcriptional regulator n=1 Tax=Oceaniglobus ichthyenteri TaxID=2136177 RepID=UPI000D3993D0|nr:HlyU family transcriptional regulator [Oceaniglobus ichthyenteri]
MSLWSRLFGGGGGAPAAPQGETHAGFTIYPEPVNDGGRWRIGARIEKQIDGTLQSHKMIRADTLDSAEAATEASLKKAKMFVDQQGDDIFR